MKQAWLSLLCWSLAMPGGIAMEARADEFVEQRTMAIAGELRCLVCQNESIAASPADLAVDLRRQIREQIAGGKSDQEIMSYMVDRYGDFVRYRPPLKLTTVLLWFGPALMLVVSLVALVVYLRRRSRRLDDAPFSQEDARRAETLLRHNPDAGS